MNLTRPRALASLRGPGPARARRSRRRSTGRLSLCAIVAISVLAVGSPATAQSPEVAAQPKGEGRIPGPDSEAFRDLDQGRKGAAPQMGAVEAERTRPSVPARAELPAEPLEPGEKPKPERELVERRTRHEEVWENEDGTQTTRVSSHPINFQVGDRWERIDTRLVPNPGRDGWYTTKANDWSVSFGPIGTDGTGGVEIVDQDQDLRFAPRIERGSVLPKVTRKGDESIVTYEDVWPGVDVRYTVNAVAVKEDIVVRERGRSSFPFAVQGDPLEPEPGVPGGFTTKPGDERGLRVLPPTVEDVEGRRIDAQARPTSVVAERKAEADQEGSAEPTEGPASDTTTTSSSSTTTTTSTTAPPASTSTSTTTSTIAPPSDGDGDGDGALRLAAVAEEEVAARPPGQEMIVSVDAAWFAGLRDDQLPIVVDPTVYVNTPDLLHRSYADPGSGGAVINDSWVRLGNNVAATWRGGVTFNYSRPGIANNLRDILFAGVTMSGDAVGVESPAAELYWASGDSYNAVAPGHGKIADGVWSYDSWTNVEEVQFEVTDQLQSWISNNQMGAIMGLSSPAPFSGHYSELDNVVLEYLENVLPIAPTLSAPLTDARVVADHNPILWWNPGTATDTEGDPLKWAVRVGTGPDAISGTVADSGWLPHSTPGWLIPAGTLRDGQTYYWSVWVTDGLAEVAASNGPRTLIVDRRVGDDGGRTDQLGPITTNLVTGNASVSLSTPMMQTVNGPLGVSMTHDSISERQGLEGSYFVDHTSATNPAPDRVFNDADELRLRGVDSQVNFNWDTISPTVALPTDNILARWDGYVAFGDDGIGAVDQWQIGVANDDGARIYIDGNLDGVLDAAPVVNDWAPGMLGAPSFSSAQWSSASLPRKIRVEYFEATGAAKVELWAKRVVGGTLDVRVPSSWLTYQPRVLPSGWNLDVGDHQIGYTNARVNDQGITVTRADGSTAQFRLAAGAFLPPVGEAEEDDIVSLNADGKVTLHSDDGLIYLFGTDGRLEQATSGADDLKPAAPTVSYTASGRIKAVKDAVSGREIFLDYAGEPGMSCPAEPSWVAPQVVAPGPAGMLCRVRLWDGTATELFYSSSNPDGKLVWVRNPGDSYTGMSWNGDSISYLIDPLNTDLVLTGALPSGLERMYALTYMVGKVKTITAPEPFPGHARPARSYEIENGGTGYDAFPGGFSTVTATGLSGPQRTVHYNDRGLLTKDADALGRETKFFYDGMTDRVSEVERPDLKRVFTWYDHAHRPIRETVPYSSGTAGSQPDTLTAYDEGMTSLLATWWTNESYLGAPKARTLGIGGSGGNIAVDWGSGNPTNIPSDKFSIRLTGEIQLDTSGSYSFGANIDDTVRIYVDDVLVHSSNTPGFAAGSNVTLQSGRHRIRVDYRETGGAARLELQWRPPGSGSHFVIPGSKLFPRLGLPTSTIDPDGLKTATAYSNGVIGPQHGLATHAIDDPAGLNLIETTAYEVPGVGYFRPTSTTLPGGNTRTYHYYAPGATSTNPCTGVASDQGGLLFKTIEPDPDAAGPESAIQREVRYDAAGRPVAQATYTTSGPTAADWVCTAYDARGRVTQVTYPAYGGAPARTETTNHLWNGVPSATLVTDAAGSVGTMVDGLGRPAYHWDVFGVQTQVTYDQAGRLTSTVNAKTGTVARTYDAGSQLTGMTYNGNQIASGLTYDPAGRLLTVTYPSGAGKIGNGTTGTFTYDARGASASVTWRTPTSTVITSDAVVRTAAGRYWDQTVDGVTPVASQEYAYDLAGRLTVGYVAGRAQSFGYGAAGCGANVNAGKNTNRTLLAQTDNGAPNTYTTYCYDFADRLTSSSDPAVGTISYDTHGNTTAIFGETHGYDMADRHRSTTKGTTTVVYARDVTDRITHRTVNGTLVAKYSYGAIGDSPSATLDTANNLIEADLSLPGGAMVSTRTAGNVWSYPNLHGDIVAAANQAGVKQGATATYDPFGNRVGTTPAIDNSAGAFDYGWVGQHQRPVETEATLQPIIEMGARQYSPLLGRFLEVDPIEGGSANDYDYTYGDPVNNYDLDGTKACKKGYQRDRQGHCNKIRANRNAVPKACKGIHPFGQSSCAANFKKCGRARCGAGRSGLEGLTRAAKAVGRAMVDAGRCPGNLVMMVSDADDVVTAAAVTAVAVRLRNPGLAGVAAYATAESARSLGQSYRAAARSC